MLDDFFPLEVSVLSSNALDNYIIQEYFPQASNSCNSRLGENYFYNRRREMLSLYKKYDEKFVLDNMMGPNSLKIAEEVSNHLDLHSGMKILDLGCGKGLTSIFLAKEFGVTVFASDLWISATENLERIKDMELEN